MGGPYLNLLYFSSGYTTHDRRYLQSFVDAGYRVSYLRLLGERLDNRPLPEGVCPIAWLGDDRPLDTLVDYFVRYAALRRIVAELHPQVVLAGPVQTSAFLVALTAYSPLVTMSWGSDLLVDASRSVVMRHITRFTLHRSAGVLGDCQAVRDKIHSFAPLADNLIVTFPWGIDLERFVPGSSALSLRQNLGWIDKTVLISTRTWEPIYAIDVLVRAFAWVHERHPKARLLLLGEGSQAPIIRRLISQLNLTDCIHAPGWISYELVPEYFRMADVYVSSALSDGTSISLLEAMACGLPVVVTNNHGNLEWVKPGENGWLVVPGDYVSLADALDKALTDPSRLAKMKQANSASARAKADWNRNFPRLLQLLQEVAG